MQYRPMNPTDYAAWRPLWNGYLTFYKATIDDATTDLTFRRLTGDDATMGAFLALDDSGEAIGVVHWITHRSCWTAGDYCYLQDLYVAEGHRNRGVGRALIDLVYAEAHRRGCSRVWWLTHETNTDAMALYEKVATRSGFLQYRKML